MATAAASSLKEDMAESYHMPVDVEEWINKEFGAEMDQAGSHETSPELITFITAQLVDEYINTAEFMLQHEEQAAPFTFFAAPLDEGLFYEPDLWSFS